MPKAQRPHRVKNFPCGYWCEVLPNKEKLLLQRGHFYAGKEDSQCAKGGFLMN
jgi:hypothetical protein